MSYTGTIVDCEWDQWSSWTECDVTCDGGIQMRNRTKSVLALHNGKECVGSNRETRSCNTQECPSKHLLNTTINYNACTHCECLSFSCEFSDPCKPNPCFWNRHCTPLSETEFKCADCPSGYEGNGIKCSPMNEVCDAIPSTNLMTYFCSAKLTHAPV